MQVGAKGWKEFVIKICLIFVRHHLDWAEMKKVDIFFTLFFKSFPLRMSAFHFFGEFFYFLFFPFQTTKGFGPSEWFEPLSSQPIQNMDITKFSWGKTIEGAFWIFRFCVSEKTEQKLFSWTA